MRRFFIAVLLLFMSAPLFAQGGKPSTKEERDRAVQIAHKLEANPLDESLKPDRVWLLKWASDASDFTVSLCAGKSEFRKKNYKYGAELTFQKLASATAFIVEHPDQQQDKVAQELAAVNGTLNAYEAILKVDPKGHTEYWDDLLKRRQDGNLKEFVSNYVASECSGKSKG